MAFCPQCKAEMPKTAVVCPSCNYDFPAKDITAPDVPSGFAYSAIADIALMVGSVAAGFAAILAAYLTLLKLLDGQWWGGLVEGPLTVFVMLGILVVFLRVQAPR
jgi:hypothetical protein